MSKRLSVEVWVTRFGVSLRVVERKTDGKFVNNMSVKQLNRIQDHLSKQHVNDVLTYITKERTNA